MALPGLRQLVRGLGATRGALGAVATSDGLQGGRREGAAPARTFFKGRSGEKRRSQSRVLSGYESNVFEMQIHQFKCDCKEEYVKTAGENFLRISEDEKFPIELIGSWTTMIGPVQDQAIHIWMYTGYDKFEQAADLMKQDPQWQDYLRARNKLIVSRSAQILLPFTFWPPITSVQQRGLYELRSYTLKPGTMIEWGQAWEQGINYRRDESVGGWFSQIGLMHQVHHLWAYTDLKERNEIRQAAWEFPGWDECVIKTVPLIRRMHSQILLPAPYSPLK